jgi:serine beta-lactamase-like protein LACTB
MRRFVPAFAVLLAVLPISAPLPAQVASPRFAEAIEASRRTIADTMTALRVPGAQIAVVVDGELVWSEGFGLADIEQQVPVTARTRLRIASISKAVTAVGVGLLVQDGKLDLDAEVQRYVPDFPRKPWPVTVRQVAGHIAGIRHYKDGEFESMRPYPNVREGLRIFEDDSLLFEPGTRYSYSTYGWNLMSAVVEGASGEPFLDFMRRRVFGPFGMTRTVAEYPDSIIPDRGRSYVHAAEGAPAQNAPYVDNSYKWAGGGFLATAEDLVRLGRKLLEGRVLRREVAETLWTSLRLRDGTATGYGIGWSTRTDTSGRRRVGHTGGAMGGTSNLVIYPEERVVAALIVNSDITFIGLLPRIAERFVGAEVSTAP